MKDRMVPWQTDKFILRTLTAYEAVIIFAFNNYNREIKETIS